MTEKKTLHACLPCDDRIPPPPPQHRAGGSFHLSFVENRLAGRKKKKRDTRVGEDGNIPEVYLKPRPYRSGLYFLRDGRQQRASALQALSVRDLFLGCEVGFPRRSAPLRSYIIPANAECANGVSRANASQLGGAKERNRGKVGLFASLLAERGTSVICD